MPTGQLHGPHLRDLRWDDKPVEEVARHFRQHPDLQSQKRYERGLRSAGRQGDRERFRRLLRAYFLPSNVADVHADAGSIYLAALALKDADRAEVVNYLSRLDPKEVRYVRRVMNDPNPPPDERSGLGDWQELQQWARAEPMITAFAGFSTSPWYGVINRTAVRRQYQTLTARIGGRTFWASGWVYPFFGGGGMLAMLAVCIGILLMVDDSKVTYKVVDGEPIAVIGHWFNWWWTLGLTFGIGSPVAFAGWPVTLSSMWRVSFADLYALQLEPRGTRLVYKLKFKTAILNHAANSQAFGGATGKGGGLRGGYAVHITRENLMAMPARKVLELPLRGGIDTGMVEAVQAGDDAANIIEDLSVIKGDAIQALLAEGDHLFDGAQARATAADASTIQKAGEIKQQWAKKRQGQKFPVAEVGGWIIILIMVIAIFVQVQSGFSLTDAATQSF